MSFDGQVAKRILNRGGKVERKPPSLFLFHTSMFIIGIGYYISKIMNESFNRNEDVLTANRWEY